MHSRKAKRTLVVEFIGVTGVGKSTLIAAVTRFLSAQGIRVCDAEDAILSRLGLTVPLHRKLRSVLVLLVSLPSFVRYFFTREGASLSRMSLELIGRGTRSFGTGVSLIRNVVKRFGSHFLLERLRGEMRNVDVILWDEGIVHAAHNLFVHTDTEPRPEEIEEFGRLVPKPDVVIWVTAPTAQCTDVLLARRHSRVPPTAAAALAFVEHAQTTFEVLCGVRGLRERTYRMDNSVLSADKNSPALQRRASAIGEFLVERLQEESSPLPRLLAAAYLATSA